MGEVANKPLKLRLLTIQSHPAGLGRVSLLGNLVSILNERTRVRGVHEDANVVRGVRIVGVVCSYLAYREEQQIEKRVTERRSAKLQADKVREHLCLPSQPDHDALHRDTSLGERTLQR